MKASLRVEAIGDNLHQSARLAGARTDGSFPQRYGRAFSVPPRPWCAEITGFDATYGLQRVFLRGKKDYARANGTGSRGIYRLYLLESGHYYEVQYARSWKRLERYFCTVTEDGEIIRLEEGALYACLHTLP